MDAVRTWDSPDEEYRWRHAISLPLRRARTPEELDAAWRCVYQCYVQRGLVAPHRLPMRMIPHHLFPGTQVLCVMPPDPTPHYQALGTLTLVDGRQLPLPMEDLFEREITALPTARSLLLEATCLAIREDAGRMARPIMRALMGMAAQAARRRGADLLLVTVHPRHARFYQREAGFVMCGPTRRYALVGNALAVPLELNLARLPIDQPRLHRKYFGMSLPPAAIAADFLPDAAILHARRRWEQLHRTSGRHVRDLCINGWRPRLEECRRYAACGAADPSELARW